jgi:hypothetical protein
MNAWFSSCFLWCVVCVVNLYVYYCYKTNQTTAVALQNQDLFSLQLCQMLNTMENR